MKITTKDVIKILPMDERFRLSLLTEFDDMHPDEKFQMERVLWDVYGQYYTFRLQQNMQKALLKAEKNEAQLGPKLFSKVRIQTEEELKRESMTKVETVDLHEVRERIQNLMKEKQEFMIREQKHLNEMHHSIQNLLERKKSN